MNPDTSILIAKVKLWLRPRSIGEARLVPISVGEAGWVLVDPDISTVNEIIEVVRVIRHL